MLQILGAGFGRTGTHSLALALEMLGFGPCYTIQEINKNPGHRDIWNEAIDGKSIDWKQLYSKYQSAVEWPTISFLPQILGHFPEALVILTLRDPESWYESAAATIFPALEATAQHPDPAKKVSSSMKRRLILERVFENNYWDKSKAINIYENHMRAVTKMVPAERLLQFRVTEGWIPICEFLEVPVPNEPFPKKNERSDFLASAPDWAKRIMKRGK